MESFRLSGLASTTCATLSWLGHLPSWQAEAIQFLSKMLRGHVAIDNQLDKALAGDHLISAEAMFQGDAWTSAGLFDITLVLQQKAEEAEAQKRDAEVEKAKEEAEKNGAKEKTETTKLPCLKQSLTRTDLWQQVFWFWVRSSRTNAGRR